MRAHAHTRTEQNPFTLSVCVIFIESYIYIYIIYIICVCKLQECLKGVMWMSYNCTMCHVNVCECKKKKKFEKRNLKKERKKFTSTVISVNNDGRQTLVGYQARIAHSIVPSQAPGLGRAVLTCQQRSLTISAIVSFHTNFNLITPPYHSYTSATLRCLANVALIFSITYLFIGG